jgi:hypothetical protein
MNFTLPCSTSHRFTLSAYDLYPNDERPLSDNIQICNNILFPVVRRSDCHYNHRHFISFSVFFPYCKMSMNKCASSFSYINTFPIAIDLKIQGLISL